MVMRGPGSWCFGSEVLNWQVDPRRLDGYFYKTPFLKQDKTMGGNSHRAFFGGEECQRLDRCSKVLSIDVKEDVGQLAP